ncbi:hypothetical protein PoMZ_01764 [Pyricularia oryzae]|uniref:Uncharacterized protein n=1 Tax=Pyricularia oryzae TaxID=318829 RepID=A0A4P7N308_PYROR|nr:hypothetical protein PoMZ_01764 [Pyricularia oryzae]
MKQCLCCALPRSPQWLGWPTPGTCCVLLTLSHRNKAFTAAFTPGLFCLPGAAFWLQRRPKVKGKHQRRWEWVQGRVFMLQKAKLEADGIGP